MLSESITEKIRVVFGFLLLAPSLADVLQKLSDTLQPERHWMEWLVCVCGAIIGQIALRADSVLRGIGGLFIGYVVGLYGGVDLAKRLEIDPQLGRLMAALAGDLLLRGIFKAIDYVFKKPGESVDFLAEKGGKIVDVLGSSTMEKVPDILERILAVFRRKKGGGPPE